MRVNGMQRVPDPYSALGVPRHATEDQIRAAHRALAKQYHPDAGGDTARFLAVQEAYLLLSDPLRRRDWDARHAPGPMRAADAGPGRRSRPRDGRWTREDSGAGSRGPADGAAPVNGSRPSGSDSSGSARGASGGPAAGSPGRSAGGSAGGRGGGRERPRDTARAAADANPRDDASTPGEQWTGSGRDPSSRSYTWSAQGVPWWEDFAPRDRGAPGQSGEARQSGTPGPSGASGPSGAPRPSGEAPPQGAGAPQAPGATSDTEDRAGAETRSGTGPGSGRPGIGRRARRHGSHRSPGASGSEAPTTGPAASAPHQTLDFDVYSRSSGAAWSSAARRYFRRGDADLASRGIFVHRGTQVVTGAQARQAAAEQAALRGARPVAGEAAPPEHDQRRGNPPEAGSTGVSPEGEVRTAAPRGATPEPTPSRARDRSASVAPEATVSPAGVPDGDATAVAPEGSTLAAALVGGFAGGTLMLPVALLGIVALVPPLEPAFALLLMALAVVVGALVAIGWLRAQRGISSR